ncbi:MAG: flagellar biosynthetic protein FliR [Lachnospirales bacterium]
MDVLLLIAVRLFGFTLQMPVLSTRGIPRTAKVGFILFTSMIIFSSQIVVDVEYVNSFFGFGAAIFKEFTVGYLLGFSIYFFFTTFYMAGQFIDYQIGFSMVSVMDPTTNIQIPVTGNVLYLGATAIFVVTGAFHVVLDAIMESYTLLPIGTANILSNENITVHLLDIVYSFFELSMLIAIPIVGTVILIDIAMGLLVKTVPQMNVFVVGAPIKLIVGLLLFSFILPNLDYVFDHIFDLMMDSFEILLHDLGT